MNYVKPDLASVTSLHFDAVGMARPKRLQEALDEARNYLKYYDWVSSINEEYLGVGVEGIVYVFLFGIASMRADVDPWIWVISGDLPPAYVTCENARNPYEALDAYIGAMEEWVSAARMGQSVAELIPVNVPATPSNADLLERRLKFLDARILPSLKN